MKIFLLLFAHIKSFEEKNFDLTEIMEDFDNGYSRVKRAFGGGHGKIITVDCTRGLDQASSSDPKYLVFNDFPEKMRKPITCIWSIAASPGTYIQVNIKELLLPCAGGNKLIIKDGTSNSKAICGKKPPMLTSSGSKLGFHLMLKKPGSGARVQIGFMQKDAMQGWSIKEFNAGKKTPVNTKIDRSGRMARKPGTAPRPKPVLKSTGQRPQQPQQAPQQPQQGDQDILPPSKGRAGPPKRGGPPPKPKYNPDLGATTNFRNTVRDGPADRWEKQDRRPVLIGGGIGFLLLLVGVGFYIAKLMKKDQEEQAKLNAEKKEQPRFKVPDPVQIIDTKPPLQSYDNHEISGSSEKPLTEKPSAEKQ